MKQVNKASTIARVPEFIPGHPCPGTHLLAVTEGRVTWFWKLECWTPGLERYMDSVCRLCEAHKTLHVHFRWECSHDWDWLKQPSCALAVLPDPLGAHMYKISHCWFQITIPIKCKIFSFSCFFLNTEDTGQNVSWRARYLTRDKCFKYRMIPYSTGPLVTWLHANCLDWDSNPGPQIRSHPCLPQHQKDILILKGQSHSFLPEVQTIFKQYLCNPCNTSYMAYF